MDNLSICINGRIDQNGGIKDYPFGKKNFLHLIEKAYSLPLDDQKALFSSELGEYMEKEVQRDDITVLAFKL